jgi:hypothetical protein
MKYSINYFVRFGGINIKRQKGYHKVSKTFHGPPSNRGIYAFPIKAVELFLIGGGFQGFTFEQMKARGKKIFYYNGDIWHHLTEFVKPNEILKEHGDWVKTEFKVWKKVFSRNSLRLRHGKYIKDSIWSCRTKNINEPIRSGITGIFSKDELEVFIDNKITKKVIDNY